MILKQLILPHHMYVYLLIAKGGVLHGPFPALLIARTCVIEAVLQSIRLNQIIVFKINYLNLCYTWRDFKFNDMEVLVLKDIGRAAVRKSEHHFISCNVSIGTFWFFPHNNITESSYINWWTRNWKRRCSERKCAE